MRVLPRAAPRVAAPFISWAPNAERRRKLGLSPIVTSAIAPLTRIQSAKASPSAQPQSQNARKAAEK